AAYERPAGALAVHEELDGALLRVRRDEEAADIAFRHALTPDGLPYAADGRIPNAAGLELLLAARAGGLVRIVRDADDEAVFLPLGKQQRRDIGGEGEKAPLVRTGLLAVYP